MVNLSRKCLIFGIYFSLILFYSSAFSEVNYPYSSGQVIFVQSPYNSSLYTNYNYNAHESAPQRLPNYTTNQAVFVQQPYATTQQTVASYPSTYLDNLPRTESRYMTPSAYPTTVAPAYPYANVSGYAASPIQRRPKRRLTSIPIKGKIIIQFILIPILPLLKPLLILLQRSNGFRHLIQALIQQPILRQA